MPAVHAVVQVPPYTLNFVSPNTRYEVINGKATGIHVFHGPDKCLTNQWCSLNFRSGVRQLGYSFDHGEKGLSPTVSEFPEQLEKVTFERLEETFECNFDGLVSFCEPP